MLIRQAIAADIPGIAPLVVKFREEIAQFRGHGCHATENEAGKELQGHLDRNYPVFIAQNESNETIGFIVCRTDGDVAWAESMYVLPGYRRKKIATRLYELAEQIAKDLGNGTLYNWVHPNNDAIIGFLAHRGYDVLNLIEVRKSRPDETSTTIIKVGEHDFNY